MASLPHEIYSCILSEVTEASAGYVSAEILKKAPERFFILLTENQKKAENWANDLLFFFKLNHFKEIPVIKILPEAPTLENSEDQILDANCDRLAAVTRLYDHIHSKDKNPFILIGTPKAFIDPITSEKSLKKDLLHLKPKQTIPFKDLAKKLAQNFHYDAEALCEMPGQFSIRGGLLDVYPINEDRPYRIDFFGDEIESIRSYDPNTQRSIEKTSKLTISPKFTEEGTPQSLLTDLIHAPICWILNNPTSLEAHFTQCFEENGFALSFDQRNKLKDRWFGITDLDVNIKFFPKTTHRESCQIESLHLYRSFTPTNEIGLERLQAVEANRIDFLKTILELQQKNYSIVLTFNSENELSRFDEIIAENKNLNDLKYTFLKSNLSEGFKVDFNQQLSCPKGLANKKSKGFILLTESEIFGRKRTRISALPSRLLPKHSRVDQLLDFADLVEGDYLVHLQHGICIYKGIQKINIKEKEQSVISIEFSDGITIHLPFNQSHLLSRYVGLSKIKPRLGKIGSTSWQKTRSAAEHATLDFAAKLLSIQANREHKSGFAFSLDQPWQKNFEDAFVFRETKGQLQSINDLKKDMEQATPMDRLLCADVGFGKTEVALRGAFKAVMDGKQVIIIAPTTVLAQQHFNTFRERFCEYPFAVEMLSRLRKPAQQKKILKQLKAGQIDVLIGTHRVFGKDVHFKDLGLIIIDEEHRFGVVHKEHIKSLRESVDVLAMSATPIPRTLYMALVGARNLSVIQTAPYNRLPIQTYIKTCSDQVIKNAIEFEIKRGGQVFYLHNRVKTIQQTADNLQALFPNLRIAVGHGQMDEEELESIMTDFVAGRFEVLVCTTIIESGLDIPNCNTMIIEGADRFGLAQLYQLRGRVGRSKDQAYCYLLLHEKKLIADESKKRLLALKQNNALGSGFQIAMRDLELRGSGNLLGTQQSGHVAGVGFDLYCQLLKQSIDRLKGKKDAQIIRASLWLDFIETEESSQLIDPERIGAFIPQSYINETRLRIEFYRKLATTNKNKTILDIAQTLEDRFGSYPLEVKVLLKLTQLRCLAQRKNILSIETKGNLLKCKQVTPKNEYIRIGIRFPRLTSEQPVSKLAEIKKFILNINL